MRRISLLALWFLLVAAAAQAQIELPAASPIATCTQRVGLTDISVTYSRPSSKGRIIFGNLVPYGDIWRTGANAATLLTLSTEATVGGQKVPAGKYSLFTIPGEQQWTVVLNKNTSLWGSFGYQQAEDLVRFTVAPQAGEYTETFTIEFSNLKDNSATLDLRWDETVVHIPIQVDVQRMVAERIDNAIDDAWRTYAVAASYYLDKGIETERALAFVEKSIQLREDTWNLYLKSRLLAKTGDFKSAVSVAERSLVLAQQTNNDFYINANRVNLDEWRLKLPADQRGGGNSRGR